MRVSRTLWRSLLVEILLYMCLGWAAFLAVLVLQYLGREIEDLAAVSLSVGDTLNVVRHMVLIFTSYSIPVGFLFGVLATVGRASAEFEVVAMRSCGMGAAALFAPALSAALLCSALTATSVGFVEPAARSTLRAVLHEISSRSTVVEPGRFYGIAGRVLLARERDAEGVLKGVFLSDVGETGFPYALFAERGSLRFDPENWKIHLDMEGGDLLLEQGRGEASRRIAFERFELAFPAPVSDLARRNRPRDLDFFALLEHLRQARAGALPEKILHRDPIAYEIQWQRRLAFSCAPLFFALVGVPLGLRRSRGARSFGVWICIALVAAYYLVLDFCQKLAVSEQLPPVVALWIPNAAFAAVALPLLWRMRRSEV